MTNKVPPERIDDLMARSEISTRKIGRKTTCVVCTLPNGFEIVATSACVDPNDYDETIGGNLCIDKIRNKLWELEGYRYQDNYYRTPISKKL